MNIEYKEKFSCSINEHFSVKAQRILIKLACIDGYGNGDKYSSLITPAQSCFPMCQPKDEPADFKLIYKSEPLGSYYAQTYDTN